MLLVSSPSIVTAVHQLSQRVTTPPGLYFQAFILPYLKAARCLSETICNFVLFLSHCQYSDTEMSVCHLHLMASHLVCCISAAWYCVALLNSSHSFLVFHWQKLWIAAGTWYFFGKQVEPRLEGAVKTLQRIITSPAQTNHFYIVKLPFFIHLPHNMKNCSPPKEIQTLLLMKESNKAYTGGLLFAVAKK